MSKFTVRFVLLYVSAISIFFQTFRSLKKRYMTKQIYNYILHIMIYINIMEGCFNMNE